MEITKFYINVALPEGQQLLYNTLTTAMILLDNSVFEKIFVQHNFSDVKEVEMLREHGFIVESNQETLDLLKSLRCKDSSNTMQDVGIVTTTDCNARCYYCFENGVKRYDMSTKTADDSISFLQKFCPDKHLRLFWFGGEPLINFAIIRHITNSLLNANYILDTNIITNGSLLTQEHIDFFISHYNSITFQITIDNIFDKYQSVKKYIDIDKEHAFDRTINNIKLLLRNGVQVKIRVNFKASEYEDGEKVFHALEQLFDKEDTSKLLIYLAPLSLYGNHEIISSFICQEGHPYLKLLKTHLKSAIKSNIINQNNFEDTLLSTLDLKPKCSFCGIGGERRITIDANGDLYKCHRLVGREEFKVGSVEKGIINTNKVYKFIKDTEIRDQECLDCPILPICQGGCKGNKLLYGTSHKCHNIKQVKSDVVKLYYETYMTYCE
jgi:radical SAM protein with 4Fe4S-binding SPASM domain